MGGAINGSCWWCGVFGHCRRSGQRDAQGRKAKGGSKGFKCENKCGTSKELHEVGWSSDCGHQGRPAETSTLELTAQQASAWRGLISRLLARTARIRRLGHSGVPC